jgi:alpha-galactosidase
MRAGAARDRSHGVTFMVYGDGKLLAKSRRMQWGMPAQALEANVAGVKIIELVAQSPGAANEKLPVTWANAALFDSL